MHLLRPNKHKSERETERGRGRGIKHRSAEEHTDMQTDRPRDNQTFRRAKA